jgi:predicted RNase H-like nuclease/predicted ArsR family transcriptional regulator
LRTEQYPDWVHRYSYLAGLDGELPPKNTDKDTGGAQSKGKIGDGGLRVEQSLAETPAGRSQLDYLRRLVETLKREEASSDGEFTAIGVLGSDVEILRFVADHLPAHAAAVVAIDAPLCVPNERGKRDCDHDVSLAWGPYDAGAYPANRWLLAVDGVVRGESLAAALAADHGFTQAAPLPLRGAGRYVCEVFPHPAHVALFGLGRTLKYKHKAGRSAEDAAAEFVRYQQLLAGLNKADPPLAGLEPWTSVDPAALRGRARHELEETLDAVTCAYVAWYAWWHGPARQQVFGSVGAGHILTPLPPPGVPLPPPARRRAMPEPRLPKNELPPDTLNARIGVLTRREVEARMLAPLIEALGAEFGRERVIAVVRDTIVRIAQEQGAALAESMGSAGLPAFAETLSAWTRDNALEIEVLEQSEDAFDFNVTRCRYAELYRALGVPELGAVFSCNRDGALIEGFNPGVEFTRTQTIMQGAPFCDFRYRRRPQPITLEDPA